MDNSAFLFYFCIIALAFLILLFIVLYYRASFYKRANIQNASCTNLTATNIKLKEEEHKLRAIMDSVLDGILTIDEKGEIQTFNKAAERMFGYSAEDLLGKRVNLLIPPSYLGLREGVLKPLYILQQSPKALHPCLLLYGH